MRTYLLTLAVIPALLAGCSSTSLNEDKGAPVATAKPTAVQAQPPVAQPPAVSTVKPVVAQPPTQMASTERERSVYFDFDDYTVKNDFMGMLEQQGKQLSAKPAASVRIEGNTDERGSAEYNLALGQRRAQAVLKVLKLYGAKESQLEAVSWGKEKPRAQGHDESAWAMNRRADIVSR